MATQGVISIVKNDKTLYKCVVGCNGMNASKTAEIIREQKPKNIKEVYSICSDNDFGCKDCLVVQSADNHLPEDIELGELYYTEFEDSTFNPRWRHGTASRVEVVNYSG